MKATMMIHEENMEAEEKDEEEERLYYFRILQFNK
jgi:hypothetical protein